MSVVNSASLPPLPDLSEWKELVNRIENLTNNVTIGLVGKYVKLHDAYLSVAEALRHAGYNHSANINIEWIDSEDIYESNVADMLGKCDGILIPGGFGNRGTQGKILAAEYARVHNIPYLGICLGMQIAVIEFARNVCSIAGANSGEFDEDTKNKVIDFMPDQNNQIPKGETMRLGSYPCALHAGTKISECYHVDTIAERHRHRYEFNNNYRDIMQSKGLCISGTSPDGRIVETIEIPGQRLLCRYSVPPGI